MHTYKRSKIVLGAGLGSNMRPSFLMALVLLLLLSGCMDRVVVVPRPEPMPPQKELPRMGHTIQMGAFSNVDNAIRLTKELERQGLNAYYFHHKTGLFKVRFGDFPSREPAAAKAEELVSAGTIDGYYIVSPDDYALARARIYGPANLRDEIVETAESFIGLPYQWGGSSPEEGFDCSGLSMAVYQLNGLNLPRSSREQFMAGAQIERSGLAKGDLVFFATSGGKKTSHVGVYEGDGRFIHAP
ncbi:MAG: NlpC/P60 family protein, partial [Desulfobacterales bacterium]|nr:NlpC/P60 family protein [Desulfobacterales bacterium]